VTRVSGMSGEAEIWRYLRRVVTTVPELPVSALPELKKVVLRLLELWSAEHGWAELELNPVIASGETVTVVDALAVPGRR
jgi:hypothetical protein